MTTPGSLSAFGAAALLEAMLAIAALSGSVAWLPLLAIHAAASAGLLFVAVSARRTSLIIGAVTTAAAGLPGALCALFLQYRLARHCEAASDEAWRDILSGEAFDDSDDTFSRLVHGRALNPRRALPKRFESVLRTGSLREQQSLIGLIAQSYHPDFAELLETALRSPIAAVRVQAASAYTALRTRERLRLDQALGPISQDRLNAAAVARLSILLNSTFLDETEKNATKSALLEAIHREAETAGDARLRNRARILADAGLFVDAATVLGRPAGGGSLQGGVHNVPLG